MTLSQIEAAISSLPAQDLAALMRWLGEFMGDQMDQSAWDKQIAADSASGKLDAFINEAMQQSGKATDL